MDQQRPASDFTFRGNLKNSRYGWLRLTPAYSVKVVRELLETRARPDLPVLDPFCGTGTTLLACAEADVACHTIDINPFLVWLAQTKSRQFRGRDLASAQELVGEMAAAAKRPRAQDWQPALHNIHRWWSEPVLGALKGAHGPLAPTKSTTAAAALARIAFCRTLIEVSEASFAHQSMSFKSKNQAPDKSAAGPGRAERSRAGRLVADALLKNITQITEAAAAPLSKSPRQAFLGDSRTVERTLPDASYGSVITSPPYCNRMSYIRELRPYMYWLGYLSESPEAGKLDWKCIGGTWGVATSNLSRWEPDAQRPVSFRGFKKLKANIAKESPTLAAYVHRYFEDLSSHVEGIARVLAPGGRAHYIVGNSKFYDEMVPTERILAAQFREHGLKKVSVDVLRKRTSKKELYEYVVSGEKPR